MGLHGSGRWSLVGKAGMLVVLLAALSSAGASGSGFGFALVRRGAVGKGPTRDLAFFPGGERLVVASGERVFVLRLSSDGSEPRATELTGTTGTVFGVAVSPDGRTVAAVDEKGELLLWEAQAGTLRARVRKAHRGEARSVAFTADGRYVLTGGEKGDVGVWTPDGQRFTDLSTDQRHRGAVTAVLPRGPDRNAFAIDAEGHVVLWDIDTQRPLRPSNVDMEVLSAAMGGGGRILALGLRKLEAITRTVTDSLRLIDAETGTELLDLPGQGQDLDAVAVTPDGRYVAVAGSAARARVWDVETGRPVTEIPLEDPATALAFDTTGRWLAAGTEEGGVSLFELTGVGSAPAPSGGGSSLVIVIIEPETVILGRGAPAVRVPTRSLRVRGRIKSPFPLESVQVGGHDITAIQPDGDGGYLFTAFVPLPKPGKRQIEIVAENQRGALGRASFVVERPEHVPRPDPTKGRRIALIVGVSAYADSSIDLEFADDDARAVYDLLTSPDLGASAFDPKDVRLLIDEDATAAAINTGLREFLQRATEDDFVLFYFAGHGAPDPNRPQDLYLLAHDTDPNNIAGTGLLMRHVREAIASIRARDVLILTDACHSAGMGAPANMRSVATNTINQVFLDKMRHSSGGLAILTASEAAQYSLERAERKHGIFTWYLLQALRGRADQDGDSIVSLGEAMEFVREHVKDETHGRQIPAIGPTSFDRAFPLVVTGGGGGR